MMNLRNVFLLTSICSLENIYCSEIPKPINTAAINSSENVIVIKKTDSHANAASTTTILSDVPDLIPTPQPSTFITRTWYGISKHVAGMSAYAIFMELNKNGRLRADFDNNPAEAINRLNDTASERFTQKDLLAPDKQEKIALLFKTAHDISAEFALAKAIAATYLKPQQAAITAILKKQALETEPALRAERRSVIKEAKLKYTRELNKELDHAKNAASNCRYLHEKSGTQDEFGYQKETHYQGLQEYSNLLESIQKQNHVPAISVTNNADEQAYEAYSESYDAADLEIKVNK